MSETTAQDVADRGFEPAKRAQSLIEALPYIDRFRGAVIVVKFGGNAMVDPSSVAPSPKTSCFCAASG